MIVELCESNNLSGKLRKLNLVMALVLHYDDMILPDLNLFAADNFLWHDDFMKRALTSVPKGSDAQNRVN